MNKLFTQAKVKTGRSEEGNRTITGLASKAIIDRDEELIQWHAWKKDLDEFRANPLLMLNHTYTGYEGLPVGTVPWIEPTPEGLTFRGRFASEGISPVADIVYGLYKDGVMKSFSCGFIPIDWTDNPYYTKGGREPKRIYTRVRLLEISCVTIPSNAAAVVQELKSLPQSQCVQKALNLLHGEEQRLVKLDRESLEGILGPLVRQILDEFSQQTVQEITEYAETKLMRALGRPF